MTREQIEQLWREANNKAEDFQPDAPTQKLIDQFVAQYQAAGLKKPTLSSDQPTPETDELWQKHGRLSQALAAQSLALCGRLERERDEAREALRQAHKDYGFELRDPNDTICPPPC